MEFPWVMFTLAMLLPMILAARWYAARKRHQDEPAPCSIVLLLRRPIPLNAQLVAAWLSEETGRKIEALDAEDSQAQPGDDQVANDVVIGRSPHLVAIVDGTFFLVHNLPAPYMPEPLKAAQEIQELRLRKAVAEHKAWISMDILHPPEAASTDNYRIVARFLSHLVGDDCLALYHPPLCRFATCTEGTLESLRGDDPIQALFGAWQEAPVIPIDDDPRLKAAEAEARRRFGEFEEAVQNHDGDGFSVKVAITVDGNTEHIWVDVERISDGKIEGTLGNEPVELGDLRLGSKVTIEKGQVEDWAIIRGSDMVGAFTLPVFQEIQEERARGK